MIRITRTIQPSVVRVASATLGGRLIQRPLTRYVELVLSARVTNRVNVPSLEGLGPFRIHFPGLTSRLLPAVRFADWSYGTANCVGHPAKSDFNYAGSDIGCTSSITPPASRMTRSQRRANARLWVTMREVS